MNTIKLIFLLFFSFFTNCSNDQSKLNKDKINNDNSRLLLLSFYRNMGECLRKEISSISSTYTCSKFDNGLCSTNLLIYTSGERNKLLSDTSKIIDKRPECKESLALSGLLNQSVTSQDESDSIKKNNIFTGMETCNIKGFTNYEKLVSKTELIFLVSARGKIGTTAYKSAQSPFDSSIRKNARDCLTSEYSETENQLFKDIYSEIKLLEIKCAINTDTDLCK